MSNLNNNAALNEMITLLGGGTSFQGLTDGQLRASALVTTSLPTTTEGYSTSRYIYSLGTTNATLVKNAAGSIGAIQLSSTLTNTTVAYLKLYNKATTPIPGTDVPFAVYKIGNATPAIIDFPRGLRMSQGIGFAITRGASPVDSAVIGIGEITGNIIYI
jgi:hypothetical protein